MRTAIQFAGAINETRMALWALSRSCPIELVPDDLGEPLIFVPRGVGMSCRTLGTLKAKPTHQKLQLFLAQAFQVAFAKSV